MAQARCGRVPHDAHTPPHPERREGRPHDAEPTPPDERAEGQGCAADDHDRQPACGDEAVGASLGGHHRDVVGWAEEVGGEADGFAVGWGEVGVEDEPVDQL
jgi:hypothetical protein